ncbi:MAG: hypothetical protein KDC98_13600 [Planctomycetes bacterium]|nr:hypothetical protein [Planctomycetota bacterium]
MRHLAFVATLTAWTMAGPLAAQQVHPDELALKPRIDAAIADGVEHLLDHQFRDGSWGVVGEELGGQAALCAYALLKCGVALDHPALQRAFGFLDSITPTRTYSTACMMMAYNATAQSRYQARLRQLLAILVSTQHEQGTWAYPVGAPDLSNTQYAALGLWTASKAGLKVPVETWTKLIEGTLRHQESFRMVAATANGDKTGASQREIAGFQYRVENAKTALDATGTMTTAGISILKICEIGLGKNLRGNERKQLTRALDAGLGWLVVNFSVDADQKPGQQSNRLLYYLYGMERVGGLTRLEQFGEHWWYVNGARVVLDRQQDGGWGPIHDTCFALLFLRRATVNAPMTGLGAGGGKSRHLFASGQGLDDIHLCGSGQQPLMLYIKQFGELLLDEHGQYGLRILRVDYLEGDRIIGQLAADPTKAWNKLETFLHRVPALGHGSHTIRARVTAIDPGCAPGDLSKTVTIESQPMEVRIRDVIEPWMRSLAEMQRNNALAGIAITATASSNATQARQAVDGMIHTHWLGDAADEAPTLSFEFAESVKARSLTLTQPLQRAEDAERIGVITRLELTCNRDKNPIVVDMDPNPLAATVVELPRTRQLRLLSLRVVGRSGKAALPVGFAEIVLTSGK